MYTYNKNDKSYSFSPDDLDIDNLVAEIEDKNEKENINQADSVDEDTNKHKKIEVINGGNDLEISPVTDYIEIEKPKNEKKENIVIPENNN